MNPTQHSSGTSYGGNASASPTPLRTASVGRISFGGGGNQDIKPLAAICTTIQQRNHRSWSIAKPGGAQRSRSLALATRDVNAVVRTVVTHRAAFKACAACEGVDAVAVSARCITSHEGPD